MREKKLRYFLHDLSWIIVTITNNRSSLTIITDYTVHTLSDKMNYLRVYISLSLSCGMFQYWIFSTGLHIGQKCFWIFFVSKKNKLEKALINKKIKRKEAFLIFLEIIYYWLWTSLTLQPVVIPTTKFKSKTMF